VELEAKAWLALDLQSLEVEELEIRLGAWVILYIKVETVQGLPTALSQEAVVEVVLEHPVWDPMRFPI
jgi:hypothetical protein